MAPEPGSDAAALHAALVEQLKADHNLTDPAVEAAFRAVPRHHFLPGLPLTQVYSDEAIPTKYEAGLPISSSSQPAIMAIMLQQLAVAPGHRVLEIGAGTGYNAALLGHLAGPTGRVVSLDIDADLVRAARAHLEEVAADNVTVLQADGGHGYPPEAPYDRIILTVGAWDIAPAWIEQLKPGGRLVLPLELGRGAQKSIAFDKLVGDAGETRLQSVSVRDCGFMRLRGDFAGPERVVAIGPEPGLHLMTGDNPMPPAERLAEWLLAGPERWPIGLRAERRELWQGVSFWLSLNDPGYCDVSVEAEFARQHGVPWLLRFEGKRVMCYGFGSVDEGGLALLEFAPTGGQARPPDDSERGELALASYGPRPHGTAARRLGRALADWHAAGRPGSAGLEVRAYPLETPYEAKAGEVVVNKRYTRLVIRWGRASSR